MSKPILNVVSFSGGKDSTAMLLKMLEKEIPVDVVLFCDTGLEFPALYRHIQKVEQKTGIDVTTVKNDDDFEYLFARKQIIRKSEKTIEKYGLNRLGYSWAGPRQRWCTERLKKQPRERFLRQLRDNYDVIEFIGIAADEKHRINRKCNQRENVRLPLVEWNMTEADCLEYCYEHGYDWEGLYTKMSRVSCWCCPLQSLKELRVLYFDFPELWEQLLKWDAMTWRSFRSDYSVIQLGKRFDFEKQWRKAGKSLGTKAFYSALKNHLKENDFEKIDARQFI